MTIKVSAGLPAGTYHLTVIGDEHGNTHRGHRHVRGRRRRGGAAALDRPGPARLVGGAPLPPRTVSTGSVGIHRIRGTAAPSGAAAPTPVATLAGRRPRAGRDG